LKSIAEDSAATFEFELFDYYHGSQPRRCCTAVLTAVAGSDTAATVLAAPVEILHSLQHIKPLRCQVVRVVNENPILRQLCPLATVHIHHSHLCPLSALWQAEVATCEKPVSLNFSHVCPEPVLAK
jgi:hypothetical protein